MSDTLSKSDRPLVSAVIPTWNRPQLLGCAIRSVLRQTWSNMEVIVVVDGPDPETAGYLDTITDARLRVVFLTEHCGGSDARNAGVRAARGEWVAFLDDDDEWLPEKIERQMRAAHAMPDWFPVVSCRLIAQSPTTSRVLPLESYLPMQPIADFLFCRKTLRDPGGLMQSSTLLTTRELLLAVPFQSGLKLHQDIDWVVRAASYKGVGFSMIRQPLSIWRIGDGCRRVGSNPDWNLSLSWIRRSRDLISPRAFSWFVAVQCVWRARASRAGLLARLSILRAFLFEGSPGIRSSVIFLIFALVPQTIRRSLRKGLQRVRGDADPAEGLHLAFARKPAAPVLRKSSL
ncbi:MAG TPA: glycosyltransferase family 2 protein [Acidobacteriaceae bacterium]|jgi:glycosyltransferase involved in cell wall biosynthesis|nr:glycosyltransferase family 2 protein [Acidobacteriaceae bacterium]